MYGQIRQQAKSQSKSRVFRMPSWEADGLTGRSRMLSRGMNDQPHADASCLSVPIPQLAAVSRSKRRTASNDVGVARVSCRPGAVGEDRHVQGHERLLKAWQRFSLLSADD